MTRNGAVLGAMLAAALGVPAAAADEARVQVEQRIRLAARTLADSPAVQRIVASGHVAARTHLDEGRLHQSHAEQALARGDLTAARKSADEALMPLAMARRLVPDVPAHQAALRARHEQMLAAIERLIEAWRVRTGTASADTELLDATGLVGNARLLGQEARYEESLRLLAAAEQQVLAGLGRLHASRELDYTVRSDTPLDEYRQELARHGELAELVPLAVRELKPGPDAQKLIERYQQTARTLRAQAQQRMDAGDPTAALVQIREASQVLQRALGAAGVHTPNPTESKP